MIRFTTALRLRQPHIQSCLIGLAIVASIACTAPPRDTTGRDGEPTIPSAAPSAAFGSEPDAGSQAMSSVAQQAPSLAGQLVTVYKSPACECCGKWVEHLRNSGFRVTTVDREDVTPVKEQYGVSEQLASCHTAIVDGYVVEGHVPAEDIKRLLRERPAVTGIAASGMPVGTPGMEMPGNPGEPYDVVSFDRQGKTRVFASH